MAMVISLAFNLRILEVVLESVCWNSRQPEPDGTSRGHTQQFKFFQGVGQEHVHWIQHAVANACCFLTVMHVLAT